MPSQAAACDSCILGKKKDLFEGTHTDKKMHSRTAKDSRGLTRTCQVLDQSLHLPLFALQVMDQSLPVLGNPGDTPRTETRKIQNQCRAYKGRIGAIFSSNNSYWVHQEGFFQYVTLQKS